MLLGLLDQTLEQFDLDLHLFLLSNPVGPGDGLQVVLRIEIRVVDDDSVRGLEIYTETTSFSWEKETEIFRVRGVERVDRLFSLLRVDWAVETLVGKPSEPEIFLDDVEHDHHLAEDQNSVSGLAEPSQ